MLLAFRKSGPLKLQSIRTLASHPRVAGRLPIKIPRCTLGDGTQRNFFDFAAALVIVVGEQLALATS
jgi:hypothetical protein